MLYLATLAEQEHLQQEREPPSRLQCLRGGSREPSALSLFPARSHKKPQALVMWSVTVSQRWSRNWKSSGSSFLSDSRLDHKHLLDLIVQNNSRRNSHSSGRTCIYVGRAVCRNNIGRVRCLLLGKHEEVTNVFVFLTSDWPAPGWYGPTESSINGFSHAAFCLVPPSPACRPLPGFSRHCWGSFSACSLPSFHPALTK